MHLLSGTNPEKLGIDDAKLRRTRLFLQPQPQISGEKRIIPESRFYLIDIMSEKSTLQKGVDMGIFLYVAILRQWKQPFCEKKSYDEPPPSRNCWKKQRIR